MNGKKRHQNPKELRGDLSLSFRSKSLKSINEFPLCAFMGRCGIPYFWYNRNGILYICQVATFLSIVCTIFACLSIGVSDKLTKVGAWSTGTGEIQGSIPTTAWVGLSGAVWRSQTGDTWTDNYVLWEDNECYADYDSEPYCDNCNSAGNSAVGLVLLAAVTRVPSLLLLQARMLERADEPLFKFLGFISETLAFCCFAGATFVWREYCHKQLPFNHDMNYRFGGGFILVGLGLALTCCIAITHAAMPCETPDVRARHTRQEQTDRPTHSPGSNHRHNSIELPGRGDKGRQGSSKGSRASSSPAGATATPRTRGSKDPITTPPASARGGQGSGDRQSSRRRDQKERSQRNGPGELPREDKASTPSTTGQRSEGRRVSRESGSGESGPDGRKEGRRRSSSRKEHRHRERSREGRRSSHHSPQIELPIGAADRDESIHHNPYDADSSIELAELGITLGGETRRYEHYSPGYGNGDF